MSRHLLLLATATVLVASSCATQTRPRESEAVPVATGTSPVVSDTEAAGRPQVETLLEADRTVTGESLVYPVGIPPQVTAQIVTIESGQTTGWHRHTVPTFGYILSGHLEVEYAGDGRRQLGPGERLMEAIHTAHNATNLGTEPVRILAVFMGSQGKPVVMKADPPSMPAELGKGRRADLVELPSVDPRLRIDLRYATTNNFTHHEVYPSAHAFLQRPAAEALKRANDRARAAGYGLLVLDVYRPWSVTRMFWDRFPMHRAYLADPLAGSRHNRGCAVDLTLFDLETGAEVKMPSAYDDFSERAHPEYTGGSAAERDARDLLRRTMEAEGFAVYENEWWHYDFTGWQDYPVMDVSFADAASR